MSCCRNEFRLKNFLLDDPSPELLVSSRWQDQMTSKLWYLIFRVVLACYHTGWCLYLFIDSNGVDSPFKSKFFFFIYLTDWSYTVLTAMNVVWAVNVCRAHHKYRKEGSRPSSVGKGLKLQWLLHNITYMPALIVSIIYWLALYEPGSPLSAPNVEAHLMNSVFVILDLMVSATPIRLLHFYQPIMYLAIYVLFSVIYYLAGGLTYDGSSYIYPVLDWTKPGDTTLFILYGLLASLLLQVMVWLVFKTRELLYYYAITRRTRAGSFPLQPLQDETYTI